MISLLVDESHAFDFLSILQIKSNLDPTSILKLETLNQCKKHLEQQLPETFNQILNSTEYNELLLANIETFKAVDLAKLDKVSASFVDKLNYKRFTKKQNLQAKFFNNTLSENKIGYEKYKNPV